MRLRPRGGNKPMQEKIGIYGTGTIGSGQATLTIGNGCETVVIGHSKGGQ